jgi:hypothetical protein
MLLLLNVVLTIVSTLCALGLFLLGLLLLLGKLRFDGQTRSQVSRWLGTAINGSQPTMMLPLPESPGGVEPARTTANSAPSPLPTGTSPTVPLQPTADPAHRFSTTDLMPPRPPAGSIAPTKSAFAADGMAPPEAPVDASPQSNGTNERLLIQLLRLLEGDVERRDRLINYAKYRHPGQSYTWYLEKVIHELERAQNR